MEEFTYPVLKTPPKPSLLVIDGDSILFKAASSGETTWYIAKDITTGKEVARFNSASSYKGWLECVKEGFDMDFNYQGNAESIVREVEYEIKDVKTCYRAFDHLVNEWVDMSGCEDWIMYIGKATGMKNFRYDIATIFPYKHGREKMRKPHHLEAVRRYAAKKTNVKVIRGEIEVDDRVVELCEKKYKHISMLGYIDKDSAQAKGCWHMYVGGRNEPFFVSVKNVGNMYQDGKKIFATSHLMVAYQMLKGDKEVDGIVGLPSYGGKTAFKLLGKYDGVDIKHLPEVWQTVANEYKKVYGDEHTYNHCYTGEIVTRDWKEIFEENLRLLWMKRYKEDKGEVVMKLLGDVI